MAGATTRGAFPYPSPSDADDVPADLQRLAERVAQLAAFDAQGPLAAMPPAGTSGFWYYAEDIGEVFRDDGTEWRRISLSSPTTVTSKDASEVPLTINGTSGQSADLLRVGAAKVTAEGNVHDGSGRVYSPGNPMPGLAVAPDDKVAADAPNTYAQGFTRQEMSQPTGSNGGWPVAYGLVFTIREGARTVQTVYDSVLSLTVQRRAVNDTTWSDWSVIRQAVQAATEDRTNGSLTGFSEFYSVTANTSKLARTCVFSFIGGDISGGTITYYGRDNGAGNGPVFLTETFTVDFIDGELTWTGPITNPEPIISVIRQQRLRPRVAQLTANSSSVSNLTRIAALDIVDVYLVAGMLYELSFSGLVRSSFSGGNNSIGRVRIYRDAGVQLKTTGGVVLPSTAVGGSAEMSTTVVGDGALHTFYVTLERIDTIASNALYLNAGTADPATLLVRPVGFP